MNKAPASRHIRAISRAASNTARPQCCLCRNCRIPRLPPAKPPPRARAKSPAPRSSPCPKSDISAAASFAAQVPVEKLRRPPERVDQRLIPHEYVALLRIVDFREILPLVDQLLAKLHRILEHYVIVHNSVHHQKRVLQHAGKVDRRAAPVSFGILLRLAQPLFRVVSVVILPVVYRRKRCARAKRV